MKSRHSIGALADQKPVCPYFVILIGSMRIAGRVVREMMGL